jgi:two-component system sensor histidine kinase KdpD
MGAAHTAWITRISSRKTEHINPKRPTNALALRKFLECFAAAILASFLTYVAFRLQFTLPAVSCLYLLMVVLAALRWGVWEATGTTIAAFLLLDYFFMEPLYSLRVDGSANWIALGAFEFVGLVVGGLSARLREHALVAEQERNNLKRLYELSRCVLLLDRREPPGHQIALFVQRAIGIKSIALFDPSSAQTDWAGAANSALSDLARNAWVQDANSDADGDHTWARVLRVGCKSIGAIAMCGRDVNPLIADATASIAAITLERSRTLDNETRAEASRQSDQLRTAVLDALAHAFKTPLTAIRAASSGLLEAGSLRPQEAELVTLIDDESAHLSDLATRLLQTARLEKADVPLCRKEWSISTLIEEVLERFPGGFDGHPVDLDIASPEARLSGNGELIVVALFQLVDNALKYSTPGSPVNIAVESSIREVVISVHNEGSMIRPDDRERLFERFYRAPGTENQAPGTGLGLSITRKVAEAHRGRTWALSDERGGTTFFFTLPLEPEGHR